MKSVLKSFRLKDVYNNFLLEKAEEMGISQAAVIEKALDKLMINSKQWEEDLISISQDKTYKKEQRDLANEFYEDL